MKAIDSYGVDRGKVEVRNTRRGSLQEKMWEEIKKFWLKNLTEKGK